MEWKWMRDLDPDFSAAFNFYGPHRDSHVRVRLTILLPRPTSWSLCGRKKLKPLGGPIESSRPSKQDIPFHSIPFLSFQYIPKMTSFLKQDELQKLKDFIDYSEPYCSPFDAQCTEEQFTYIDKTPNGLGDLWYGLKCIFDDKYDGKLNNPKLLLKHLLDFDQELYKFEYRFDTKFDGDLYDKLHTLKCEVLAHVPKTLVEVTKLVPFPTLEVQIAVGKLTGYLEGYCSPSQFVFEEDRELNTEQYKYMRENTNLSSHYLKLHDSYHYLSPKELYDELTKFKAELGDFGLHFPNLFKPHWCGSLYDMLENALHEVQQHM